MKDEIKKVEEEVTGWKKNIDQVYSVAIGTIEQNYKREKFMVKVLVAIIMALLGINLYFGYELATTTVAETTETTQEGVYNFYDSEGNMVSSDLSLEEMRELIELNEGIQDGKDYNENN